MFAVTSCCLLLCKIMNTDEVNQSSANVTSLDTNNANDITPSQFEELKRLILTSSNQINERISALELKLTNEFEELKKEDKLLADAIEANKKVHEDDVKIIKERLDAHDDMATSLDEANEKIEFLEKRIVSLEKSCHSS